MQQYHEQQKQQFETERVASAMEMEARLAKKEARRKAEATAKAERRLLAERKVAAQLEAQLRERKRSLKDSAVRELPPQTRPRFHLEESTSALAAQSVLCQDERALSR
jgi:membrane protein involved in colicin uptake